MRRTALAIALILPLVSGCAGFREYTSDPQVRAALVEIPAPAIRAAVQPTNPVEWLTLADALYGLIIASVGFFTGRKNGASAERSKLGLDRIPIPDELKARPSVAPKGV